MSDIPENLYSEKSSTSLGFDIINEVLENNSLDFVTVETSNVYE